MEFLEILASGRYHRDMKILKILTSNSKPIDDDVGWGGRGRWEVGGNGKIQQFFK